MEGFVFSMTAQSLLVIIGCDCCACYKNLIAKLNLYSLLMLNLSGKPGVC